MVDIFCLFVPPSPPSLLLTLLSHSIWIRIQSVLSPPPHPTPVFKPIFASAKIRINPNAEQELDSPKAQLHLEVQNIDIQITKPQVPPKK